MTGRSLVVAVATAGDKAIAGPLVASAIVLDADMAEPRFTWTGPAGSRSAGLDATDRMPSAKRQEASAWLKKAALGTSAVVFTPRQLDQHPPRAARRVALGRAVVRAVEHAQFRCGNGRPVTALIQVNGSVPVLAKYAGVIPQELYRGRDARPWTVWAAYLLARAQRDQLMDIAATTYPAYGFHQNAGHASEEHRGAIELYGLTPHHRTTSQLVRSLRIA